MFLIEHNGQQMLVKSLKGHEGCTVLSKGAREPKDSRKPKMSEDELIAHIIARLGAK